MKRNYGIDLLKIAAMFMVVMGHVILSGGVNEAVIPLRGSCAYYTVFGIRLITICAVNCFVLATGYLYYGRKVRLSRIIELYLQVLFLSIVVLLGALVFGYRPTGLQYLKTFLPLSTYHYWFITQYMLLMFFVPFLNRLVEVLNVKEAVSLTGALVFVFSLLPTFLMPKEIPLNGGYTVVWFAVLYVLGAMIKKFDLAAKVRLSHAAGLFAASPILGCALSAWGSFSAAHFGLGGGCLCYQYNAPTVLLEAFALTLLFMKIDIRHQGVQKAVMFVSPLVFGVYVLHSNCVFRAAFGWNGRWQSMGCAHPLLIVLGLVGISLTIFTIGMLIDFCRQILFRWIGKVLS